MFTDDLRHQAASILDTCRQKGIKLATAESCTGGLLAALFTDIAGSSTVYERGYVTYSNQAKTEMLAVDATHIEHHGAVSEQIAQSMAQGALTRAHVDLAVAITGIAGPGGGSREKPVGLVYIAIATHENILVDKNLFDGSRSEIRLRSVEKALTLLKNTLKHSFISVA